MPFISRWGLIFYFKILINRKYGDLFPTLNASQKIDEDNNLNISYSRRITRPTFNHLAPFTVFFDPKTYYSGNPALQPAIANTVLPAEFALELTGSYSSPAYLGTEKRKTVYQVDAGLKKKLGREGDLLCFAANDIFNSGNDWRFGETLPGSGAIVNRTFNYGTVAYRLTYTHHFGNDALKAKRERTTGAEEELKRVHN